MDNLWKNIMINTLNYENLIIAFKFGKLNIDDFRSLLKDLRDKEKDICLIHATNNLMNYLDDYITGIEIGVPIRYLSDVHNECKWCLDVFEQLNGHFAIDHNDIRIIQTILTEMKYSYSGRDLECIGLNKDDIQRLLNKFKMEDE